MRWITHPGWPGNLLAAVAGSLTTLALAPFDIWPLAVLSLALLPRYSVSCRVLEYSWRFPLPNRGNFENREGSLLPGLSVFVFLTALNGRRKRRVAR